MRLAELIAHCGIIEGCQLFSKKQLVEQMLLQLAIHGCIPVAELPSLCDAIMRRESLGSTGIAMPHTRHPSVQRTSFSAFLFRPPVQFDSVDAEPVDIFLLFLTPQNDRTDRKLTDHFSRLHRQLACDDFRERFRNCATGDEIQRMICSIETDSW